MKRFLSSFTALFFIINIFFSAQQSFAISDDESYFIVTAYYSPLPNQNHYLTGNYESEKILNGEGIAGASGKKVFSGMLAAPSKYSFGTKIYLDGLGIGEVSDRGGAIVPAGQRGYNYDRIDIWMGYGDEGLKRAMFWGKRKVYGYVVDSGNPVDLDFSEIPAPDWATSSLQSKLTSKEETTKQTVEETVEELNIFNISLGKESSEEYVKELQNILVKLDILKTEQITGKYDKNTIDTIYNFQLAHNIINAENTAGAGFYGPQTRAKLKEVYELFMQEEELQKQMLAEFQKLKEKAFEEAELYVETIGVPAYGDISTNVRELQKTLALLEYFNYKDTAIFGVKTKNSLIEYQLNAEIIIDANDSSAGVFGPQTRAQFIEDITELYFKNYLKENELLSEYENMTEIEVIAEGDTLEVTKNEEDIGERIYRI